MVVDGIGVEVEHRGADRAPNRTDEAGRERREQEQGNTYTPMTDCFFGASLLMMAVGRREAGEGRLRKMEMRRKGVDGVVKWKMRREEEEEILREVNPSTKRRRKSFCCWEARWGLAQLGDCRVFPKHLRVTRFSGSDNGDVL